MSNKKGRYSLIEIYAIFHLNLAFSSVDESAHAEIINRCYWPLLDLIDKHNIPLALELSVSTCEKIAKQDPNWIQTFKKLLNEKKCELLACGDSQIIGPLVPSDVNRKNLELGLAGYEQWLAQRPSIAYVNEQAFSAGLLDIYAELGFSTVVVEWENPYSHNENWSSDTAKQSQQLLTASGKSIQVVWNRAIAFQKLQRYAHGEYSLEEYLEYITALCREGHKALCIYGNDAEVFDYRPGRFNTEVKSEYRENERLQSLFLHLADQPNFRWLKPSELKKADADPLSATNASYPISVKKQAKYNITRWAVSGRNDLVVNTQCFDKLKQIRKGAQSNDKDWRDLCRLWASDLRTHLTPTRYASLSSELAQADQDKTQLIKFLNASVIRLPDFVEYSDSNHQLRISTPELELVLNTYRGLSILSLSFKQHDFEPVCGTLKQGYFDHILYGADFYSNHLVMERFRERDRVTDLNKTPFELRQLDDSLVISCDMPGVQGGLVKWYEIKGETITSGFSFKNKARPECSLRLGFMTLKQTEQRCWYAAHLGSEHLEYFDAESDFDHGSSVSSITSSSSSLSATNGYCYFGSSENGLKLSWDQSKCAALPMASSKAIGDKYLNRLWFSLVESDETLKPGGQLLDFEFEISPILRSDL